MFLCFSSGAFGVGNNCDSVAVQIKEEKPGSDVRYLIMVVHLRQLWWCIWVKIDLIIVVHLRQLLWCIWHKIDLIIVVLLMQEPGAMCDGRTWLLPIGSSRRRLRPHWRWNCCRQFLGGWGGVFLKLTPDIIFKVDQSCVEEMGAGSPGCLMFTTYYPYIETPFMLVVPYEDTNMEVLDTSLDGKCLNNSQVHPCTPPLDEQPSFWEAWRAEMFQLALQVVEVV